MVDSKHLNLQNIIQSLHTNLLLLVKKSCPQTRHEEKAIFVVTHEEGLTLNLNEFI